MSMAFTHFSVGATLGIVLAYAFGYRNNASFAGMIAGYWAMVPDIWRVTPLPKSFHEHTVSNLFFAHHHFDTVLDTGDSRVIAMAGGVALFVALFIHTSMQFRTATEMNA